MRDVVQAGNKIRRTRQAAEDALEEARLVAISAVEDYGEAEAAVALNMGVSRTTVRKWLGK